MARLTSGWTFFALEHGGHHHEVLQRGVRAGADEHLVDLLPGELPYGHAPCQGCGGKLPGARVARKVDLDDLVIGGALIGSRASERLLPSLGRRNARVTSSLGKMEVVAPSSAPMLVMVARSGTVKALHAGSAVLEDPADAALDREPSQELEDDVLGADPGLKADLK